MKTKTIHPLTSVAGTVEVPGDKSISHRSIILGALSNRSCTVENFLVAEDCLCTLEAFRAMGISIERQDRQVVLQGRGLDGLRAPKAPLWFGNSGTTTRLMMGVLTGQPFDVRMEGDASLSRRPMDRVIEPLSKMGAFFLDVKESPAHLPLRMHGTRDVRALQWKSNVASAQVKSAILLAGLYASGMTEVSEPSPSRDHTERMLQGSGVPVERQGNTVRINGTATVRAHQFKVPGDISSAAFLLAAGLLLGKEDVVVRGVGVNPSRTGFIDAVKAMSGHCRLLNATESSGEPLADIAASKSALKATTIEGAMIPRLIDEIPVLAVLATQAQGRTIISDAKELRVKESDRITTLREELSKMGAHIEEKEDGLIIDGPTPLHGAVVRSHGDHRLAMSFAIAALVADGATTIEGVESVDTSFPSFWELLENVRR
jgi:3-phosphoshikimate 1-carboxyvinyltransferase